MSVVPPIEQFNPKAVRSWTELSDAEKLQSMTGSPGTLDQRLTQSENYGLHILSEMLKASDQLEELAALKYFHPNALQVIRTIFLQMKNDIRITQDNRKAGNSDG